MPDYYLQGCIKLTITSPGRGSLSTMLGKNIKFGRGECNIKGVGENIMWKKGNWKKYPLLFDLKAVRKNIKWGRALEIFVRKSRL